jgi:F420H(2)-dependent quinone reductase
MSSEVNKEPPAPPKGHGAFALWNRSGNRGVAALLRSPMHRLVSGRLVLLTVTGRRSGKKISLPVAYKQDGERLKIPVLFPQRKLWWRNLRDGAPVTVRLRGVDRAGHGQVQGDGDDITVEVLLDTPA